MNRKVSYNLLQNRPHSAIPVIRLQDVVDHHLSIPLKANCRKPHPQAPKDRLPKHYQLHHHRIVHNRYCVPCAIMVWPSWSRRTIPPAECDPHLVAHPIDKPSYHPQLQALAAVALLPAEPPGP
ncbi:unnamed protein product [Linum trigynum]|uniref:Uncharacterized protein n=1 Tax=Linum trigynum TaxID=586398 RepID=A0AAV2FG09_9ROSI